MAFTDLRTKKIYGCEKDSLTWWHEKGHLEFSDSVLGNYHSFWQGNIFVLIVVITATSLIFSFLKYLAFSLAVLYVVFYIFEEIWCWNYAMRMKNGDGRSS